MGQSIQPCATPFERVRLIPHLGSEDDVQHQIIVAGVLERNEHYLIIEEMVNGRQLINQPAGRLEVGESASEGAVRETLEESGFLFVPEALVGIYQWCDVECKTLYLRLSFTGDLVQQEDPKPTDAHTMAVRWLTLSELKHEVDRHRSPYVLQSVLDHANGKRYPLELVHFFGTPKIY